MLHSPAIDSVGSAFIGVVFSVFLYGIIVCQAFIYFRHYPHDKPWMKIFIAFLVLTDTLHSIFSVGFIYDKLVLHFDDISSLMVSTWLFETYPALVGIISTSVQLFFAWRVKILTENMWIFCLVAVLSLPQAVGGLAFAIEAGRVKQFRRFDEFKPLIIIWLSMSTVCEVTITLALTWTLQKHRAKKFITTEDIVKRVMRLTLQNGFITTVWTIADLITVLVSSNGAHFIFCYPLAKLYINSLISTLNARPEAREEPTYRTSLMGLSSTTGYTHLTMTHTEEGSGDSLMADPRTKSMSFGSDYSGGMKSITLPKSPTTHTRFASDSRHTHDESWDSAQISLTETLLSTTQ